MEYLKNLGSDILKFEDLKLLKEWLGINPNNDLKLKLVYKASRDKDTAAAFWEKCENIDNTFTFVKSK